MDGETITVPKEIKSPLNFKDKEGRFYFLSPTTYSHIKRDHSIQDPCVFIKDTLLEPVAIIEDKTRKDRWIYHRDYKNNLYKVVVTSLADRKIKTAFISDEVKGGRIIWIDKKKLIR